MDYLIGHLVGDYLLQTHEMGMNKKNSGKEGWLWCSSHCAAYTISVMLFTGWAWNIAPLVFMSHWIVDRYKWLQWLHINVYKRPTLCSGSALGTFVYIAADNTCHLVLLWLIAKYLI
jgi:hypothetical protein